MEYRAAPAKPPARAESGASKQLGLKSLLLTACFRENDFLSFVTYRAERAQISFEKLAKVGSTHCYCGQQNKVLIRSSD